MRFLLDMNTILRLADENVTKGNLSKKHLGA